MKGRILILAIGMGVCLCLLGNLAMPTVALAKDDDVTKKILKHLKKYDIKAIPEDKDYPDAEAVIIHDHILKRQFFGVNSLWDFTWQEERYKVWKVLKPEVERFKTVILELGATGQLDDFEMIVYNPAGEETKIKKDQVQVKDIETPAGGRKFRQAIVSLPKLVAGTYIEMTLVIKHNTPLYWDKMILGGLDPIFTLYYGITLPDFTRNTPTSLYRPVVITNPLAYRFRAFDATKKKPLTQTMDKDIFFFNFEKIPAWRPGPNVLPLANTTSYVGFSLNELIVKNPLGKYDEKFEDYMQIPSDTPQTFIINAGSPEGFRLPFESWDAAADFVYGDVMIDLAKSAVFADVAKKIIGDQTVEGVKIKTIYDYLATDFQVFPSALPELMPPTVANLEKSLQEKKALACDLGFIFWGLLKQIGVSAWVGLGYSQDQYFGEYDRKFAQMVPFTQSMVTTGTGPGMKIYFPGDSSVRMGGYPPEIASVDFLLMALKTDDELTKEPANSRDPKSPYITVRKSTRVKTSWQAIDSGNPTANKISGKYEITVGETDSVTMSGTVTFAGFKEIEQRRSLKGLDETKAVEAAKAWFAKVSPGVTIESLKINNLDKVNADLAYAVKITAPYTIKDGKLSIPFNLFDTKQLLPFTLGETKPAYLFMPYRFGIFDDFMVTFEKGWKVASAPAKSEHKVNEGLLMINIRETPIQYNYQRGYAFTQIFLPEDKVQGALDLIKKIEDVGKSDALLLEKK